jgi:High potential iron-sulfur protein
METQRRYFLSQVLAVAGLAPFAAIWGSRAFAADTAVCYDPVALSLAQKRQRRAIGYVEPSADANKRCARCAFFTSGGKPVNCGTCQLLSGGPVVASGVCNSFAPKAG